MKAPSFAYHRASSIQDVTDLLAQYDGDARILAGGQSLMPMLNLRLARPSALIDISSLEEIRSIEMSGTTISIGAGVTHAELEFSAHRGTTFDILRHVAGGIAYRAIRNRGTIGGSLSHADPAADWLSCLLALDAQICIAGKSGTRSSPLSDFVISAFTTALGTDEFVIRIDVPVLAKDVPWGFYKHNRKVGEFAEAIGCIVRDNERNSFRVVAGAFASPPVLLFDPHDGPAHTPSFADVRAAVAGLADDKAALHFHAAAVMRAIERSEAS